MKRRIVLFSFMVALLVVVPMSAAQAAPHESWSQAARPVLRQGAMGAAVVDLQSVLNAWIRSSGTQLSQLSADGMFGPLTHRTVIAFQHAHKLDVDGIVGPKTWAALEASRNTPIKPVIAETGSAPCAAGQIKGNRNSGIYHSPGQRDYERTKVNVWCFDTADEAERAGFRAALR